MKFICQKYFVVVIALIVSISTDSATSYPNSVPSDRPPRAKYGFSQFTTNRKIEVDAVNKWTQESGTNVWEHSGLHEGDIMLHGNHRNGIIGDARRWPNATVPFFIDENFEDSEIMTILAAMQEYHNRTCVRFRPYVEGDKNWIEIVSDYGGCWSAVGMLDQGQTVNLHSPKCIRHGVVVHELMHVLGFFHQQSASDRDDYVDILWENIRDGAGLNFKKYSKTRVTDFDVGYDYSSVMHYSSKAFSKNGNITIRPKKPDMKIGQRKGMSEKDILKVNAMYANSCNTNPVNIFDYVTVIDEQEEEGHLDHLKNWIANLL